ncbi:MAG: hypothetical protein ACKODU_02870, partial [Limnohabitans sp.]
HHRASQRPQYSSHKTGSSTFREKHHRTFEMRERSEGKNGVPEEDSSHGGWQQRSEHAQMGQETGQTS